MCEIAPIIQNIIHNNNQLHTVRQFFRWAPIDVRYPGVVIIRHRRLQTTFVVRLTFDGKTRVLDHERHVTRIRSTTFPDTLVHGGHVTFIRELPRRDSPIQSDVMVDFGDAVIPTCTASTVRLFDALFRQTRLF